MTDNPLVSIITPSYNQAPFLEQTIRSVLAQDYPRIEYIVVDGASTDGSVEIIKRHESRIARWVSEPDRGQSDAINKGFRMATGDVVAWINSDDLYFPDAVSTAVERFTQDPGLGLFYGNCVFIDRDGAFVRYFTEVEPYDEFRLRNCSDFIMQPTTFFRRDLLEKIGLLDESLHFTMDWDLWCRFAESGCGIHCEPKLIAATRVYPETKTTAGSRPRLDEVKQILNRHKTAWWPHGWFGFYATEVRRLLERADLPFFRRLRLNLLLFLLRLGNLRNILYDRRRPNNLYGLRRRTNELMQHARLTWPLHRDAGQLRLTLSSTTRSSTRPTPTLTITINGRTQSPVGVSGSGQPFTFTLPKSVSDSHVIDLELALAGPDARATHPVLKKCELL
jgi:glycosyltransferase involved in cell wall biosynthesis